MGWALCSVSSKVRHLPLLSHTLLFILLQLVDENRWYHFDDGHVSLVSDTEISTAAAYLLFYQRVKVIDLIV